jgi:hypothetical protein
MKTFRHPFMGQFSIGDEGFVRITRIGCSRVTVILDCLYAGEEHVQENLKACLTIAERVWPRLDRIALAARVAVAKRTLKIVNRILIAEEKKCVDARTLESMLKLNEVCVSPVDIVFTFFGRPYDDEHGLFRVRCGPQGGIKDAYVE